MRRAVNGVFADSAESAAGDLVFGKAAPKRVAVSSEIVADRPPVIAPLPAQSARPFWSVMIPVYNCREDYLRKTLSSVLCQDPGDADMQIELIDNCSTIGDPERLVREMGGGRIEYYRQLANLGIAENFNTCIRRARGQWVHILHADDTVRPDFYRRARAGVAVHSEAGAALCRLIYMDEDDQWMGLAEIEGRTPSVLDFGFAERQLLDQRVQFVAMVVHRSIYERLGGFRPSLPHCLDWDMWKRVAVTTPIYYDPEPLACYRLHTGADSSRLIASGENVVEERLSIEYSCAELVPEKYAPLARRAARKAAAVRALRRARQLWRKGQRAAAWRQFSQGSRCSLAPSVLAHLAYFLMRTVLG